MGIVTKYLMTVDEGGAPRRWAILAICSKNIAIQTLFQSHFALFEAI